MTACLHLIQASVQHECMIQGKSRNMQLHTQAFQDITAARVNALKLQHMIANTAHSLAPTVELSKAMMANYLLLGESLPARKVNTIYVSVAFRNIPCTHSMEAGKHRAMPTKNACCRHLNSLAAFGVQTSCHCMQINQLKQTHHAAAAGDAHAAIMRPPRSAGAPSLLQAAI